MNEADFLAEVSIFWFMKKKDLRRIAKQTKHHSFREGDVIIKEGDRDGRLFIVLSGQAEVIKSLGSKSERHLATLGPRSYFGEMALIDNFVRSASVVAKGDTQVLSLDQLNLRHEIERYPLLGIELLQMLSRRIRAIEKSMTNTLRAFLPICAHCKKIRKENDSWTPIEEYIVDHSETEISYSICPECSKPKGSKA